MERDQTQRVITSSAELAERALTGLLNGVSITEEQSELLTRRGGIFEIEQAGRRGSFDIRKLRILLGSACPGVQVSVDVTLDTERGPEKFELDLDPEGNPNFRVFASADVVGTPD